MVFFLVTEIDGQIVIANLNSFFIFDNTYGKG